jgi:hypothetical protein
MLPAPISRRSTSSVPARQKNDAAATLRAEYGQERARQLQHPKEIRLHHAPDIGVGQILEHAGNGNAGVVHDRIERVAGLGKHGRHRGLDRCGVGDVELHKGDALGKSSIFQCALRGVLALEVAHGGEHAPASCREKFGGDTPEAGRCSGDQDSWHSSSCQSLQRSPEFALAAW